MPTQATVRAPPARCGPSSSARCCSSRPRARANSPAGVMGNTRRASASWSWASASPARRRCSRCSPRWASTWPSTCRGSRGTTATGRFRTSSRASGTPSSTRRRGATETSTATTPAFGSSSRSGRRRTSGSSPRRSTSVSRRGNGKTATTTSIERRASRLTTLRTSTSSTTRTGTTSSRKRSTTSPSSSTSSAPATAPTSRRPGGISPRPRGRRCRKTWILDFFRFRTAEQRAASNTASRRRRRKEAYSCRRARSWTPCAVTWLAPAA
mmetsp:Transcript_2619/g.7641  ORF Transcript_2619/g.7641 Transcript_2619/m.7641 type:complete len:268 (+) Transcript_2619:474-1277(+)